MGEFPNTAPFLVGSARQVEMFPKFQPQEQSQVVSFVDQWPEKDHHGTWAAWECGASPRDPSNAPVRACSSLGPLSCHLC